MKKNNHSILCLQAVYPFLYLVLDLFLLSLLGRIGTGIGKGREWPSIAFRVGNL
jgi:hypothetical protein